jgi:hypothetical protein
MSSTAADPAAAAAAFALFDSSSDEEDGGLSTGAADTSVVAAADAAAAPAPAPAHAVGGSDGDGELCAAAASAEAAAGLAQAFSRVKGLPDGVHFVTSVADDDDDDEGWEYVAPATPDPSSEEEDEEDGALGPGKFPTFAPPLKEGGAASAGAGWAAAALRSARLPDASASLASLGRLRSCWGRAVVHALDIAPGACAELSEAHHSGLPESLHAAAAAFLDCAAALTERKSRESPAADAIPLAAAAADGKLRRWCRAAAECLDHGHKVEQCCWAELRQKGWSTQSWRDGFVLSQLFIAVLEYSCVHLSVAPLTRQAATLQRLDVMIILGGAEASALAEPIIALLEPAVERLLRTRPSTPPGSASCLALRCPDGHTPASWAGLWSCEGGGRSSACCGRRGIGVPTGHTSFSWGVWGAGPGAASGVEGVGTGDKDARFTMPSTLDMLPAALVPQLSTDCVVREIACRASGGVSNAAFPVAQFRRECYQAAAPALFTGYAQDAGWLAAAPTTWCDLRFLMAEHGHRTVPIEIGRTDKPGSFSECTLTLSNFIEQYLLPSNMLAHLDRDALGQSGPGTGHTASGAARGPAPHTCYDVSRVGYLAQHALFQQIPSLRRYFTTPEFTTCSRSGVTNVNAWLGTAGTVTSLHFDSYDNLLVQVAGFKYVRLYAPSETPKLYVTKRGRGKSTSAQGNISRIRVEEPDFEQFPLSEHAVYTECIMAPGDMLFIPENHWHYCRGLTTSFSINFWF